MTLIVHEISRKHCTDGEAGLLFKNKRACILPRKDPTIRLKGSGRLVRNRIACLTESLCYCATKYLNEERGSLQVSTSTNEFAKLKSYEVSTK